MFRLAFRNKAPLLSHILLQWIQHRGVFEAPTPPLLLSSLDYNTLICSQTTFFVTLSTPLLFQSSISPPPPLHPPPFPLSCIQILLFISYRLYLPLLQLLLRNIRLISPHLLSQDLCFFSLPSAASLFYPSSSSRPHSVCACLPPSFHQMVCVKTLRLTARLIFFFFFFPDIILTSGGLLRPRETQKKDTQGVKGN